MGISYIPEQVPYNKYSLSDAFGGSSNPLRASDADVLMSQDVEGEAWLRHAREFDIYGREGCVRHLVRLLIALHDTHAYLRERDRYTGLFINHQEDGRIEDGENGHEFFVAETDDNIRIVASPVADLGDVKNRVKRLQRLPNSNRLYEREEQFRSKSTPILLARDHEYGEDLVDADLAVIPDPQGVLRVAYVDRYGNVLAWKEGGVENELDALRSRFGKAVGVRVGGAPTVEAHVAGSLSTCQNGVLNVYPNEHNIDFVGKWGKAFTQRQKWKHSAYVRLGKPIENITPVQFEW